MFQNPILTVDAVILTLDGDKLMVALTQRTENPFNGRLALPGGYVHGDANSGEVDGSTTDAMLRTLKTKLGFRPRHLEQVYTESGPERDPRGWSASVVHLALHHLSVLEPLVETGKITLHEVRPTLRVRSLAFDHKRLIENAVERLRGKATYSTIAAHLLHPVFTLSELRHAHEVILQQRRDASAFRRKMLMSGFFEEAELGRYEGGRPAQGYKLRQTIDYFEA